MVDWVSSWLGEWVIFTHDKIKTGVSLSLSKHGGQASAHESSTGSDWQARLNHSPNQPNQPLT